MLTTDGTPSASVSPMPSPLVTGISEPPDTNTTMSAQQASKDAEGYAAAETLIISLLKSYASACQSMARFDCRGVIGELETFPRELQRSPWVLSIAGRAYYEMVDYTKVHLSASVLLLFILLSCHM